MDIKKRLQDIYNLHNDTLYSGFSETRRFLNLRDELIGQISYEYETMLNALIAIIDYHDLNIDSTDKISGHMCSLAINAIRNVKE